MLSGFDSLKFGRPSKDPQEVIFTCSMKPVYFCICVAPHTEQQQEAATSARLLCPLQPLMLPPTYAHALLLGLQRIHYA